MTFGLVNATITQIYFGASQTKDIYGQETLTTSAPSTQRVFFEESKNERRQVGGDAAQKTAKVFTDFISGVSEGDVITVDHDTTGKSTRNWRIVNISESESPTTGINRSIYDLILEA